MTEVGRAVAGRHGLRHLLTFAKAMGERAGGALPGGAAAATGHGPVDLVVHHPIVPIGQHLAELLGVPAVVAALARPSAWAASPSGQRRVRPVRHRPPARPDGGGRGGAGRGMTAIVSGQRGASDLLAGLAGGGSAADEQELIGSAVMLFASGVDSPASMVGLGTRLLLRHPDQAARLRRQPELAARAVAEILRYEPPVQLVARAAVTPVELRPAGARPAAWCSA